MIKNNIRNIIPLLILVLFSLLIKTYVWRNTFIVNPDALEYIAQAKLIYLGDIKGARECGKHYLSIYHFFIPISYKIFKDWIIAAKAVSLFFAIMCTIPIYLSFLMISDKNTAFLCSLLFSVNPFFSRMSVEIIKDQIFWFFLCVGLFFSICWFKKEKVIYFFLSLLFFFISSLARIEGIIATFSSSFLLLLFSKKRKFIFLYALLLCIIIFTFFFKPTLWNIYFEPRLNLLFRLKEIDINKFIKIFPHILGGILYVFSLPFFFFLIAGFKRIKITFSKPEFKYFFSLSLISILSLLIFFCSVCYSRRYLSIFFFPSFFFIAPCVLDVQERLKKILPERIAFLLLAFFITIICFSYNLKERRRDILIYKKIGEYISKMEKKRFVNILAYDRRINLYANKNSLKPSCNGKLLSNIEIFQQLDDQKIIDYLKKNSIKYIIWQSDKWKTEINKKNYLKLIKEWKEKDKIYRLYLFKNEKDDN